MTLIGERGEDFLFNVFNVSRYSDPFSFSLVFFPGADGLVLNGFDGSFFSFT